MADNQQLYATIGMLALWVEPHGWWTFRHSPGEAAPAEWQQAQGTIQLIEGTGKVGRWDAGKLRPLPTQPPVPVVQTVLDSSANVLSSTYHPVVVTGLTEDGGPAVATTLDGSTWEGVTLPPEGEIGVLRAAVTRDDMWLIGERPDPRSFPVLWRRSGMANWSRVPTEGHPDEGRVVPLGGGTAAVIGPRGAGAVIGGRYVDLPWPVTAEHSLRVLADGTLFAAAPGSVLLGAGRYTQRDWVGIHLVSD